MRHCAPHPASVGAAGYVSYRRLWLDACLEACSDEMRGVVFDLGGRRGSKRGSFRPPESQAQAWWYLNLDPDASPHVTADVMRLPLAGASADCVICTEVLEHIQDPCACAGEMHRLLRPGGIAFVSAPFIYPVHADPSDYQRFTGDGLRLLFEGFSSVELLPMGGFWGTLGMLLEIGIEGMPNRTLFQRAGRGALRRIARWMCRVDLSGQPAGNPVWDKFTTGYLVRAVR